MTSVQAGWCHVVRAGLLLCVFCWYSGANVITAQRAPCYECELFKEQHPDAKPYEEIRSHCTYPCECPSRPLCPEGVHLITDGCGCCEICARQQDDLCDGKHLCDEEKGLVCEYSSGSSTTGICRVIRGASCRVGNLTYTDGETFKLDCRTQCTCQNGTYGCVSLCSQENIRPSAGCTNPSLVSMTGRCCREWMCDSRVVMPKDNAYEDGEPCELMSTDWSPCSLTCGMGVSLRLSNDNEACQLVNETRLCQIRPCQSLPRLRLTGPHHIRKNHFCRPTIHSNGMEQLKFGNCNSFKSYRSKYCGQCGSRACCVPQYTTTMRVEFQCPASELTHSTNATGNAITVVAPPTIYGEQRYDEEDIRVEEEEETMDSGEEIVDYPSNDDQNKMAAPEASLVSYPVMSIYKCICPKDCRDQAFEDLQDEDRAEKRKDLGGKTTENHSAASEARSRNRSHRHLTEDQDQKEVNRQRQTNYDANDHHRKQHHRRQKPRDNGELGSAHISPRHHARRKSHHDNNDD